MLGPSQIACQCAQPAVLCSIDLRAQVPDSRCPMSDAALPSFKNPPLDEVAAGMQFQTLPFKTADIGHLHSRIFKSYPTTVDMPPLAPSFETFGPQGHADFRLEFISTPLPRVWFISENDEHLMQFQPDRLLVNWRMRNHAEPYPRYARVRENFLRASSELSAYCQEKNYPSLQPNQCEMTYFNKIPVSNERAFVDPSTVLRNVSFVPDGAWSRLGSELRISFRRIVTIGDGPPLGRLTVELAPDRNAPNPRWALNLMCRGRPPTPDLSGVLSFLDMAHFEIVRTFEALITDARQSEWGRIR